MSKNALMNLEIPKDAPLFSDSDPDRDDESQNDDDDDDQSDSADEAPAAKKKDSGAAKPFRKKTDASDPPKKSRSGKRRNPDVIGDIDPANLLRIDFGAVSDENVRAIKREGKYYIHKGDVSTFFGLDDKAKKSLRMPGEVKGKIGGSGAGTVFLPFAGLVNTTNSKITDRPQHSFFISCRENLEKTGCAEYFVPYENNQAKKKPSSKEKAEKSEGAQSQSNGNPPAKKDPPERKKADRKKPATGDTKSVPAAPELAMFAFRLKRLAQDFDDLLTKRILVEKED